MSTLRDQILAAQDIPEKLVEVPEWSAQVLVRGMTASERTRLLELATTGEGGLELRAFYPEIVISTAYEIDGSALLFTSADRDLLLGKSAVALDRIAKVGIDLSGFGSEDDDKAGKG